MRYILKADQRVWERHTVYIEIPNDTPEDDVEAVLIEKYNDGEFQQACNIETLCVAEGDTEYTFEKDW